MCVQIIPAKELKKMDGKIVGLKIFPTQQLMDFVRKGVIPMIPEMQL